VPCLHPGAVDLRSSNHLPGDEVLHVSAAEWAEFIAAVKDSRLDDVTSADCRQPRTRRRLAGFQ
jgi:hypothetical protein